MLVQVQGSHCLCPWAFRECFQNVVSGLHAVPDILGMLVECQHRIEGGTKDLRCLMRWNMQHVTNSDKKVPQQDPLFWNDVYMQTTLNYQSTNHILFCLLLITKNSTTQQYRCELGLVLIKSSLKTREMAWCKVSGCSL